MMKVSDEGSDFSMMLMIVFTRSIIELNTCLDYHDNGKTKKCGHGITIKNGCGKRNQIKQGTAQDN